MNRQAIPSHLQLINNLLKCVARQLLKSALCIKVNTGKPATFLNWHAFHLKKQYTTISPSATPEGQWL